MNMYYEKSKLQKPVIYFEILQAAGQEHLGRI